MWGRHLLRLVGQGWPRSLPAKVRGRMTPSLSTPVCASPCGRLGPGAQLLFPSIQGQLHWRCVHMDGLKERGVYDERVYQKVKGSDVRSLEVAPDGKYVSIQWSDGRVSKFHSIWLRYTCHCPSCRVDHTGQTAMELDKITDKSLIQSAVDDGGCLEVRWTDDPGHTGVFPLKFLRANCYSKDSMEERRNDIRMTFTTNTVIPRISYEEVTGSQEGLYKWMEALNERGISIVENVPCQPGMGKQLCTLIADILQHTVYGETFEVLTTPQPINAAYSSGGLKLHMDQPTYESPPGIQALHCIKFDEAIQGGDSMFVDLFHVAEVFRQQHPDMFDLLCRVPVCHETIHYSRDWPAHLRFQRPMFTLNRHGDLIGVIWHPQLLGPPHIEEELLEPFALAYGKFYTLINNFPYTFRHRLKAGEMVAFNNRRLLHGRAAFDSQEGMRHLQGCYVEISEFKSRVNVLSNLVGDGKPAVRVGNFDHE